MSNVRGRSRTHDCCSVVMFGGGSRWYDISVRTTDPRIHNQLVRRKTCTWIVPSMQTPAWSTIVNVAEKVPRMMISPTTLQAASLAL